MLRPDYPYTAADLLRMAIEYLTDQRLGEAREVILRLNGMLDPYAERSLPAHGIYLCVLDAIGEAETAQLSYQGRLLDMAKLLVRHLRTSTGSTCPWCGDKGFTGSMYYQDMRTCLYRCGSGKGPWRPAELRAAATNQRQNTKRCDRPDCDCGCRFCKDDSGDVTPPFCCH